MSTKPLLNVTGLKAGYGAAQVLFGVDLTVAEGEVITLLGRNGMGRSTTIKCLFGLLEPKAGEIEFAPVDRYESLLRTAVLEPRRVHVVGFPRAGKLTEVERLRADGNPAASRGSL